MTAIRSSRLRWALIPLVALAVLATLALVRGERPADQRVQLPFDFRQSAGTSTDTLISSLQERIRENPKRFRLAHQIGRCLSPESARDGRPDPLHQDGRPAR